MPVATVQNLVAREPASAICSPLQLVNNSLHLLTSSQRLVNISSMTKTETISVFVYQKRKSILNTEIRRIGVLINAFYGMGI
jgi:hypothetical protein